MMAMMIINYDCDDYKDSSDFNIMIVMMLIIIMAMMTINYDCHDYIDISDDCQIMIVMAMYFINILLMMVFIRSSIISMAVIADNRIILLLYLAVFWS